MPSSAIRFDCETDDIVADAIDFIWAKLDDAFVLQMVKSIEISVSTDMAMKRIYKVTRLSTFSYDGIGVQSSQPLELLQPDSEPTPVSIDPWARGIGMIMILQHCTYNYV